MAAILASEIEIRQDKAAAKKWSGEWASDSG
jgi:hypothetical protein